MLRPPRLRLSARQRRPRASGARPHWQAPRRRDGRRALIPFARAVSEAFAGRMQAIAREYTESCAAAGLEPDQALLGEVAEALAAGNPELASERKRVGDGR